MSFESLYLVNGVTVNENLRGQAFNIYIEDAIQETTVATDGVSAEYGRFSGGLVNVITKSGGNLFSGSFRESLFNDNWRSLVTGNGNYATPAAGATTQTCNTVTSLNGAQVADPHCFAERHQGRQDRADARVRASAVRSARIACGSSPPAGSRTSRSSRNTIQPVNLAYLVRGSAEAVRGQADRLDQLEPPLRRRVREGVADAGEQHVQHRELDGRRPASTRAKRRWICTR